VSGLKLDAARQRLKDAGFQVADQPTSVNSYEPFGAVMGTTPSGQIIPGSVITITISNGVAPAPPPAPVHRQPIVEPDNDAVGGPSDTGPPPQGDSPGIQIPGLPPINMPMAEPPPPP
jgi:beta-lactam-binding protein with PASTA domain